MSGQSDQPLERGGVPVPDLIERYRLRRDEWIAQADELARLRDEVRGSAEREAMEIVTAARRDVRRVIMEARRELLVLSAQVQAALGEATARTDAAALLGESVSTEEAEHQSLSLPSAALGSASESAVEEILNEVRADISALAEDARALPLQAVPQFRAAAPDQPRLVSVPPPAPTTPVAVPSQPESTVATTHEPVADDSRPVPESPSRPFVSSPAPGDAVPVQASRRRWTVVSLVAVIGIALVAVTLWWTGGSAPADVPVASSEPEATVGGAGDDASRAVASEPEAPSPLVTPRAGLSLVAEATRDVWVRMTIDGRADQGRTLTAGQVIDVSAEKSISLRVGDAGGFMVSVNHGEKRALGRDGQAVTRLFVVSEPASAAPAAPVPAEPAASAPVQPPAVAVPPDRPGISPSAAVPPSEPSSPLPAVPAPAPPVDQVAAVAPPARVETPAARVEPTPPLDTPPARVEPPSARVEAPVPATPANAVVAAARQWLEAYQRQDRATLARLSMEDLQLADERRPDERFPPGLEDVTRTLDRVNVQIAADTAVLTAVMIEQSVSTSTPRVSPVSQVWVLAGGREWKVRQARFVSEGRLNQVFR